LYREDIQYQINEADKAVAEAVKAHEKESGKARELAKSLEKNKLDYAKLIKDLADNTRNLAKLRADSALNVATQNSILDEIMRLRKIVEDKKLKLGTIE
jgi:chromosome segregation ATPase